MIVHRHSVSEVPDPVMRSRSEAATGPIAGHPEVTLSPSPGEGRQPLRGQIGNDQSASVYQRKCDRTLWTSDG